jgi:NodT family efflux transporter outer membrane factor (OMF) lipoprotein
MGRKILALLVAMSATGCNYKKETDIPTPVAIPETYSEGAEQELPPKSDVEQIRDARWWRHMGDPTLSVLIEEALRRNPTVRAGWARVRQSKYIANQVRAARMPTVGARGDYSIGTNLTPVIGEVRAQSATGSLPVSYEVDLFARLAREHQGAKLDAAAARLDQDALAISISAEVAEAWFDAINARIEVAVVEEQLETDLRFLELVELRYREGLNSAVDVHQQRQRVASQRALLALSEAQTDLTDQRLSVLLGEAPGRPFPVDDKTLPDIGPTPDIQVPAVLLDARPDVRAARTRVEAEDRRVAAAIGARLPQLVLDFTPSYSWLDSESTGGSFFPSDPNEDTPPTSIYGFTWNAGATISVPIFDGLLGRSQINTERAIVQELVARYAETILTALSEVEGALVLERQERLRIQFLEDEFRLAGITLEATRDRYRAGLSDFLPVLTALQTRQLSELQLVSSRRQLVSYRVQLYRALGGAWPEEFGEPKDD